MTEYLDIDLETPTKIDACGAFPAQCHVWDRESVYAINMALAARRPLLVRGEPGTGKSQLARAAAVELKRAFVSRVVDSRTESQDLQWSFDAIARLARAQVLGALQNLDEDRVDAELAEIRFVAPGPLWWAFQWGSATQRAGRELPQPEGCDPANGTVVLIDEIDKADSDVPNGLLEALGNGQFTPRGSDDAIVLDPDRAPLVLVTTNEERALPDAFLRRCLVLQLTLPTERKSLIETLVARGGAHFADCTESVLRHAAEQLATDRDRVRGRGLSPPGQAEYLDLLRAVRAFAQDEEERLGLLKQLGGYVYDKHPPEETA